MHKDIGFLIKPIQPWREYDARLSLLTQQNGLIQITAFGLLGRSIRRAALLQPFNLLALEWESPKPPFNNLIDVNLIESFPLTSQQTIACGWYVNELTLYCLEGIEPEAFPNLVNAMKEALARLVLPLSQHPLLLESGLRQFEAQLLALQGYDLYTDLPALPTHALETCFQYDFNHGWQAEHQGFTHQQLKLLSHTEQWQQLYQDKILLSLLKQMHRRLINQLLGNKPFKSRSHFSTS